jgi:hypothetical protein
MIGSWSGVINPPRGEGGMKYILLKALLGWLARLGCWLNNVIAQAEERHLIGTALPPGTPVRPLCDCHRGQTWYVEEYCVSGRDYSLVPTWPPPPRFGRRRDVDDMHIERHRVALARESPGR